MKQKQMLNLSNYARPNVSNVMAGGEEFHQGLRLLLSFQHEAAALYFLDSIKAAPDCALAHAFVSYCHGPNYNFKGEAYYECSQPADADADIVDPKGTERGRQQEDANGAAPVLPYKFPCQLVADYHSKIAVDIVAKLESENNKIQDVEVKIISSIRLLTCNPGIDPTAAEAINDYPFAEAMKMVYTLYPNDPEVSYIYVGAIMTLHAWKLFEYPNGRPLSDDVPLIQSVLEDSLSKFPTHVGLCHMYIHLCEMSANPQQALLACDVLRTTFPDAGHLVHMPTHIDVLIGDYEACVKWNAAAIAADKKSMDFAPETNGDTSFYFGYIVHGYHMFVYGCILGGFEMIAMEVAEELNSLVNEDLFSKRPDLTAYLESYGAMDVHIMVRFGRWQEILKLKFPKNKLLMLNRTATLNFARALAYANLGAIDAAREEARYFETARLNPEAENRILHNNVVSVLLAVDSEMLKGEIAYFAGDHQQAFSHLRRGVELQDALNYDEPWGKMQPIRHALGGLLLKHDSEDEAEEIFRADLKLHPKNPWALAGLIGCIEKQVKKECERSGFDSDDKMEPCFCPREMKDNANKNKSIEICDLKDLLEKQRQLEWADFKIMHPCQCCCPPPGVLK
jgi:tetratricopeptide (TPR) repeat protein